MAKLVSATYGDALLELAREQNQIDSFAEEVKVILDVLGQNPDFSKIMIHPKVGKDEKLQMISDVFNGRVSGELAGFLRLVVEKERYREVEAILRYFLDCVKAEKGIGVAFVRSAVPLKDEQKKQIEQRLLETTKYKQMEMHFSQDESLIGGLVIRIGDKVVDSSIKAKLNELTKQLMKIQLA